VTRDQSIDIARGIAIVAIVIGHAERGLASASIMPLDTALTLDRILYLCHLTTFAYLSGLFVPASVERGGGVPFVRRRLVLFGWLYLLWTLIQGSVRVAASSVANTPVTFADIARIWIPEGQLWFLPWLAAVTIIAAALRPWRDRVRGAAVVAVAAVLALAVWGYDPIYAFSRGWALLLPFLLGCVVTHARHAVLARRVVFMAAVATSAGAVWMWVGLTSDAVPPTTGGDLRTPATVALGVVGCAAGTLAILTISACVARTPIAGVFALVGRRSLEIFLAHIVVTSGTRIALAQAGIADPWVHLIVATALGVVVPLALASIMDRLGWGWLFGLPRLLDREVARSSNAGVQRQR
jgi:fucose 4-O-acetylase-like acetyltransferase